jgi:hypothetical protein
MTILTSAELEVLMDLRMSWGRLYSNEITRLRNEDDSKHGADSGAYLAHEPANRNEEGVIGVLHEMPLHAVEHGSLQRLLAMSKVTVYQYMVLGTTTWANRARHAGGERERRSSASRARPKYSNTLRPRSTPRPSIQSASPRWTSPLIPDSPCPQELSVPKTEFQASRSPPQWATDPGFNAVSRSKSRDFFERSNLRVRPLKRPPMIEAQMSSL